MKKTPISIALYERIPKEGPNGTLIFMKLLATAEVSATPKVINLTIEGENKESRFEFDEKESKVTGLYVYVRNKGGVDLSRLTPYK